MSFPARKAVEQESDARPRSSRSSPIALGRLSRWRGRETGVGAKARSSEGGPISDVKKLAEQEVAEHGRRLNCVISDRDFCPLALDRQVGFLYSLVQLRTTGWGAGILGGTMGEDVRKRPLRFGPKTLHSRSSLALSVPPRPVHLSSQPRMRARTAKAEVSENTFITVPPSQPTRAVNPNTRLTA